MFERHIQRKKHMTQSMQQPFFTWAARLSVCLTVLLNTNAMSQQATLYDPQPPAQSAYVRVVAGSGPENFDVWVDQKLKLSKVATATPSHYMVIPAGPHEVTLRWGNNAVTVPLKAEASRSLTVMVANLNTQAKPTVVEDKINSNRLKAIVSAYNLTDTQTVDVFTADGKTQVFKAVPPAGSAALVVNPVSLDYKVTAGNSPDKTLAQSQFVMTSGGAYTILISTDAAGKVRSQAYANTVERYQAQ